MGVYLMSTKILKIYALIVCLVMTLSLFLITVYAYGIATDLWLTKYKYNDKLQEFNSNKEFLRSLNDKEKKTLAKLPENEITQERDQRKKEYILHIKRSAIARSVSLSGWLIISIIFLLVHWNLYRRASLSCSND